MYQNPWYLLLKLFYAVWPFKYGVEPSFNTTTTPLPLDDQITLFFSFIFFYLWGEDGVWGIILIFIYPKSKLMDRRTLVMHVMLLRYPTSIAMQFSFLFS